MKIRITDKNKEKLETALENAQKGAKTRVLSLYDIKVAIENFEKYANQYQIPKLYWVGVILKVSTYQKMPNSYKYAAAYSDAIITRTSTGWFLTRVTRDSAWRLNNSELFLAAWPESSLPVVARKMMAYEDWI